MFYNKIALPKALTGLSFLFLLMRIIVASLMLFGIFTDAMMTFDQASRKD